MLFFPMLPGNRDNCLSNCLTASDQNSVEEQGIDSRIPKLVATLARINIWPNHVLCAKIRFPQAHGLYIKTVTPWPT